MTWLSLGVAERFSGAAGTGKLVSGVAIVSDTWLMVFSWSSTADTEKVYWAPLVNESMTAIVFGPEPAAKVAVEDVFACLISTSYAATPGFVSHSRWTRPLSGVAFKLAGAGHNGVAFAVFAAPGPKMSRARTANVYSMPLVRPVTVCPVVSARLPPMAVQSGFQLLPLSSETRYSYPVMSSLPGLFQDKVVRPSPPDVACKPSGAGTGDSGVAVAVFDGSLKPKIFSART